MMLRALVELAEREHLLEGEDFEKKRIDFEIRIAGDGTYRGVVSRRGEDGKGQELWVPRIPSRSVNVRPRFLVDNAKYVLGLGEAKDSPERLAECRASFVALLRQAVAERSDDNALGAVAAFYAHFDENLRALRADAPDWTGAEMIAFSTDEGLVHDRPAARELWQRWRQAATGETPVRCLVTGQMSVPEKLHPVVRRAPGGQLTGTMMVSFNSPAFTSHGLEQGQNAPVSREAAVAYTTALNWLLEKDPTSPRPYRYGVRIDADVAAVFWTTAPAANLDFFADLWNGPRPEQVEAFYAAPWKGAPPPALDQERLHAMTLSSNASRLVVREWFESTLGQVKSALFRYFDDLDIGQGPRLFTIWQLIEAIKPPGNAQPPPDLASRLFLASLRGTPLPRELLHLALTRLHSGGAGIEDRARVALIKAVLRGIGRTVPGRAHLQEVSVSLDEDNPRPSYQLGRLFAALERAQQNALGGDVNATIRDRYFASASTSPAMVFPRLLRLAQHHISKAQSENRDYGIERVISGIVGRLPAARFPALLPLEDQGLFAVGYYHQREAFFVKKSAGQRA